MNFMEMVMALLAIVFFTTISLLYNRSMWNQAENLDNVAKVIQATHVAHSHLDRIDGELLSQQISFAKRQTGGNPPTIQQKFAPTFNSTLNRFVGTESVDLPYSGYRFILTRSHEYTDSTGNAAGISQAYNNNTNYMFVKMTVTVASTPGMRYPVTVSRVYTKTNFYLDY